MLFVKSRNGYGQVAQLAEQRTENPCVDGSIPPLAIIVAQMTRTAHPKVSGAGFLFVVVKQGWLSVVLLWYYLPLNSGVLF